MVESIIGVLAVASITVSAGLTAAVLRLHKRSQQLQKALITLQQEVASQRAAFPEAGIAPYSPLSGLRIALAIEQDHTIPTISLLLKDALSSCDAEVILLDPERSEVVANNWGQVDSHDQPDILIWGSVTCNGYSEFYYRARLNYLTPYGTLNPTSEQPAQGNPQSSLVVTVVSKLKKELGSSQQRHERSRAIQELRRETEVRQIDAR